MMANRLFLARSLQPTTGRWSVAIMLHLLRFSAAGIKVDLIAPAVDGWEEAQLIAGCVRGSDALFRLRPWITGSARTGQPLRERSRLGFCRAPSGWQVASMVRSTSKSLD